VSDDRPRIRAVTTLTDTEVSAALDLAEAAARADGAYPLGEHVMLHLRHGGGHSLHLLAEQPGTGELLGYAHIDVSDAAEGPAAELAVRPGARRRGVGRALLAEVVTQADAHPGQLRLWAHGHAAAAHELAAAQGFDQVRRLWQLRRSLLAPLAPVVLPPGITLRTFDRDRDIDAVVAVNARAFTALPDQGSWTRVHLEQRMAEKWFDPSGFLLAVDPQDTVVGFHWTKVHDHDHGAGHDHGADHDGRRHPAGHAHEPIGEVYVVGVDPAVRGIGLGRALTLAGLHHLRSRGLSTALLYVDADNIAAISLYRSLGFASWDSDTLFRR
jgi:mycothiol synthase